MRNLQRYALRFAFLNLAIALSLCQYACSSCGPKTHPVQASLVLEGQIASDCNFAAMAGTGHQTIEIYVRDSQGVAYRHYNVTNVANLTYAIEVPSTGPFEIDVTATESDHQSCPLCYGVCPWANGDGYPEWEVHAKQQLGGAAGSIYNVTLGPGGPASGPKNGCFC